MRTVSGEVTAEIVKAYNRPIELYILFLRDFTLYFAANDTDITFFSWDTDEETTSITSQVYTALAISRDDVRSNADSKVDSVRITIDNVTRGLTILLADNDLRGRRLIILKVFADLLTDRSNFIPVFDGLMDGFEVNEMSAVFSATSRLGNLDMQIPRRMYQASCNWIFGDEFCTYPVEAMGVSGQSADSGSSSAYIIDAARAEADDYWRFGKVQITSGVNKGLKRRVASSSGTRIDFDITLPSGIETGATYTLHQGCSKTQLWCSGLGNLENFGGFPTIPDLYG